jgi:hypothetical protein
MAALTQSTRRKLSLLQLAQELQNVSKACRIMGYHRDTFYEVRRAFQVGGVAALVEQRRGPRGPTPIASPRRSKPRFWPMPSSTRPTAPSGRPMNSASRGCRSASPASGASGPATTSTPASSVCSVWSELPNCQDRGRLSGKHRSKMSPVHRPSCPLAHASAPTSSSSPSSPAGLGLRPSRPAFFFSRSR